MRSNQDHPGNSAVVGFAPLDREFCDTRLSTGFARCAAGCEPTARLMYCNACARHDKRPKYGVFET